MSLIVIINSEKILVPYIGYVVLRPFKRKGAV